MTTVSNEFIGKATSKKSLEPMTGYKCTRFALVRNESGHEQILLEPLFSPNRKLVALNAISECQIFKWHKGSPGRYCDCGLYAYTSFMDSVKHTYRNHHPIIKTIMSGKLIIHDKGIRSGHQRVQDVFIQRCDAPTCAVYADRVAIFYGDSTIQEVAGVCPIHAEHVENRTFSWLEEKINASFQNNEPHVQVRSIKKSVVPWEGTESVANIKMKIREKKSTMMFNRIYEDAVIP